MDCERIAEILPWYLSDTLAPDAKQQTRAHLAQCPRCRREFQETVEAAAIYEQHPPEEALVDYAFDQPGVTHQRTLIERHLATCSACAEELKLVQESRRLSEKEVATVTVLRPAPRLADAAKISVWPIRMWQYGALAASLLGFIAIGGWLWSWQQSRQLQANLSGQQRELGERLAKLEAENQQLRQPKSLPSPPEDQTKQELAQLRAQVKELTAPQINIPVLEVYPQELAQRGTPATANQLQVPPHAQVITLILNSQSKTEARSYSLEILAAQNRVVANSQGLVRHATGDYTVSVPTRLLPSGRYTFNVYGWVDGTRVKVESYQIQVGRTRQ
jgi:anti-sigma factor RsiW